MILKNAMFIHGTIRFEGCVVKKSKIFKTAIDRDKKHIARGGSRRLRFFRVSGVGWGRVCERGRTGCLRGVGQGV